jgi:sugar/nucleoside kinase (ribokinase family)
VSFSSDLYDIAFIGHICFDEVIPYQEAARVAPGSAMLCGALAAARVGKNVAVVTRMAPLDQKILESLQQNDIAIHVIPSAETTYMKVVHPSADVDERHLYQIRNAGFFSLADLPPLAARWIHLAGITDQEFSLDFIAGLKQRGYRLSADMQSFVRQVDPVSHKVAFQDVPQKQEIIRLLDMVKLDVVEARILTGSKDLEKAASVIEAWGCPEVIITQAEGVLARVRGESFYEKFSNRSVVGRTGRGDTTLAAYLARHLDHGVADSLKFAAALVSIKMETPGPFNGNLDEVLARKQFRRKEDAFTQDPH